MLLKFIMPHAHNSYVLKINLRGNISNNVLSPVFYHNIYCVLNIISCQAT